MEPFRNASAPEAAEPIYRCPCCRYVTLRARGGYEICKVCFWEDDGQDDHDAGEIRGGSNGSLSLEAGRHNFEVHGVSEPKLLRHVRPPSPNEIRRLPLEPAVALL